jgi:hypothetical protein
MRRALILLVRSLCFFAGNAAPAGATMRAACSDPSVSRPFLPFLDPFVYAPTAGGDFESGNQRSGGSIVAGNEPWRVAGADGAGILWRHFLLFVR